MPGDCYQADAALMHLEISQDVHETDDSSDAHGVFLNFLLYYLTPKQRT